MYSYFSRLTLSAFFVLSLGILGIYSVSADEPCEDPVMCNPESSSSSSNSSDDPEYIECLQYIADGILCGTCPEPTVCETNTTNAGDLCEDSDPMVCAPMVLDNTPEVVGATATKVTVNGMKLLRIVATVQFKNRPAAHKFENIQKVTVLTFRNPYPGNSEFTPIPSNRSEITPGPVEYAIYTRDIEAAIDETTGDYELPVSVKVQATYVDSTDKENNRKSNQIMLTVN